MKRINKSVMRILKVKEQYELKDELIEKDEAFIEDINNQIEEIRKKFYNSYFEFQYFASEVHTLFFFIISSACYIDYKF